jgi:hypothetical protein
VEETEYLEYKVLGVITSRIPQGACLRTTSEMFKGTPHGIDNCPVFRVLFRDRKSSVYKSCGVGLFRHPPSQTVQVIVQLRSA